AWPTAMIFILVGMSLVILVYGIIDMRRRGIRWEVQSGAFQVLAVALGLGPSFIYHYGLKHLVAIHYSFTGTWAIGWAMVICSFIYLLAGWIERAIDRTRAPLAYSTASALLLVVIIGWNLAFVNLSAWSRELQNAGSIEIFRTLSTDLPDDGI